MTLPDPADPSLKTIRGHAIAAWTLRTSSAAQGNAPVIGP